MPASESSTVPNRPRLTDSPWYWTYLFGMAGLAGLLLIGPKFSQRQERLETRQSGRENAWKHRVQGLPLEPSQAHAGKGSPDPSPSPNKVQIWPLAVLLAAAMAGGWLLLLHHRRTCATAAAKQATTASPS